MRTYRRIVVPNVCRTVLGLRILDITILIVVLVEVTNELIVSHRALHDVVSNELVHGVIRILHIVTAIGVVSFTLSLDNWINLVPVGDITLGIKRCADTPLLLID